MHNTYDFQVYMGPFGHKTNLNKVPNNPSMFFAYTELDSVQFSSVQSLSRVQLFATQRITARQASLSITSSRSLPTTHVHRVSDAIQPSHPLSSPSPPAANPP